MEGKNMKVNPNYINPVPGDNSFSSKGVKALAAYTVSRLAAAAPSEVGDNPLPSQGQTDAYWVLRAASDLSQLYNEPQNSDPNSDYQKILADLTYIQNNCGSIPLPQGSGSSGMDFSGLLKLVTGDPTDFVSTWWDNGFAGMTIPFSSIFYNWTQDTSSTDPDFTSFPLSDDMYYFTTFMMNLMTSDSSQFSASTIVNTLFGSPNTSSPHQPGQMAEQFSQYIYSFFYQKSENADGSLNVAAFQKDIAAFNTNLGLIWQKLSLADPNAQSDYAPFYAALHGGSHTDADGTVHYFSGFIDNSNLPSGIISGVQGDYAFFSSYTQGNTPWPPPSWTALNNTTYNFPLASGALTPPPTDGSNAPNPLPPTWANSPTGTPLILFTYTGNYSYKVFYDWDQLMPYQP